MDFGRYCEVLGIVICFCCAVGHIIVATGMVRWTLTRRTRGRVDPRPEPAEFVLRSYQGRVNSKTRFQDVTYRSC